MAWLRLVACPYCGGCPRGSWTPSALRSVRVHRVKESTDVLSCLFDAVPSTRLQGCGARPRERGALNGVNAIVKPPPQDFWVDVAGGKYVGQRPSTRFPVYTRGNAGEVFPEVMYPLSYTLSVVRSCAAANRSVLAVGAFRPAELEAEPSAMIGVLGGYAYLNLSGYRVIATRTPGTNAADSDQQYLGASNAPYRRQKGDKSLIAGLRVLRYVVGVLRHPSMEQQLADEAEYRSWKASRADPKTLSDAELLAEILGAVDFGERLFENHLVVSGKAGVPITLLNRLCDKKLGDPSMMARLLSGVGNIDSAAPAVALWDLARVVRADPILMAHFDSGSAGLDDRLRADDRAKPFVNSFDVFLDEFGSRGPNEWETACPTWGTDPDMALAFVERLRLTADGNDPHVSAIRLVEERKRAYDQAVSKTGKRGQKRLDQLLTAVTVYSQGREKAKSTVVGLIHEIRLASRELGRRCAARSGAGSLFDDLWFVTAEEIGRYVEEPTNFGALIAERRAMREKLSSRIPPFIVDGVLPDWETWEVRGPNTEPAAPVGTLLSGIAGCPGVARGRARVVLDPTDPRGIEPGDVLVAPLTDPSWTPLFLAAEAVVVEVGAVLSHAVIVSRELGIPSVVSVTSATRIIPDGALIEVDGAAGTVRVLELPTES